MKERQTSLIEMALTQSKLAESAIAAGDNSTAELMIKQARATLALIPFPETKPAK